MNKKTIMAVALCIMLAAMAVVYAAFQTVLTVTGTTTQSGNFGLVLFAESGSVTGTAGLTGATAPTATCTPTETNASGSTSGTMAAKLYQPGDTVTCSYKVKNVGTLKAKANGNYSCSPSSLASPFSSSVTWKKSALAKGATSAAGEITMTITYLSSITSQPSTTTASITCNFPYTQDI